MRRNDILFTLQAHSAEIAKRFGVSSLYLFGSVARDEASPESDVDLLVAFERAPGFDGYMELRFFLEDLLGRVSVSGDGSGADSRGASGGGAGGRACRVAGDCFSAT